jgi:hydrogenase nickel incorporation protein HypA/HybF
MHELSIATSILDIVEAEAQRQGAAHVVAIHLQLGPLSGVVKDALISAFVQAREGTPLSGCRLLVEDVPLVAFCPVCGVNREIPSVQYLCCPMCDSPTPDIVTGREMDVVAMEVRA